ncbi:hypothetical protein GRS48_04575 [Halorubrum sp. JWXQ-INN 858]|uniref:hypothetical protein n=1 Tax=Halorubrum sp. JWXQ-INN 858 TaxID=2690782 RepID=UPI001356A9A1|nr:hypothetical protein [Halorubrum sp. JWXQ-INN 858]MWV64101.1 hypothetical protein [Halorubrum sp. JWXQ-INN 858]
MAGLLAEIKADLKQVVTNPTDEQKAIVVAIVAMMIADRYFLWMEWPFVVRTTAAVGVGFIVLFVVSFLLTGHLVPPDEGDDEEEYEDEFHP